jgi:hypothetical protein
MKNIGTFGLGALLMLFTALPCSAVTTIEGELVVIDGHPNQFRIVDHAGQFTAPAGISVEGLDGKPVIVELSDNRQVLRITEKHIPIDPIVHEYETIVGELVVVDATRGSFAIAGTDRTFFAPRSIDPGRYVGRRVEVFVGRDGEVRQIQLAPTSSFRNAPVYMPATSNCSYGGRGYAPGESLCQAGTQFRCEAGTWRSLGVACQGLYDDAPCDLDGMSYSAGAARCENGVRFVCDNGRWQYSNTPCGYNTASTSRSSRTCVVGSATVAAGSSICRDGMTFRCADGDWIDAGRACR